MLLFNEGQFSKVMSVTQRMLTRAQSQFVGKNRKPLIYSNLKNLEFEAHSNRINNLRVAADKFGLRPHENAHQEDRLRFLHYENSF